MRETLLKPDHEPSAWLRSRIASVLERHRTLMFAQCGHLRRDSEYTGMVPLWDDGIRSCAGCFGNYAAEGDFDYACDRCGRIDPMTAPFAALAAPHTLVRGGLCPGCGEREAL